MKLLELFSGTGSVGKVAKSLGWNVVSLDLKKADINTNILQWEYKEYERGSFDMIWASPPCTKYSMAKTVGVRKIREANNIVMKTLEIIKYFSPRFWFIENPQTGLLKKQPFMQDMDYYDVDYCKYGMKYRKRTRIWTNLIGWKPLPLCKKDCDSMVGNKHLENAQRAPAQGREHECRRHKQSELYRIPSPLIEEIFANIILLTPHALSSVSQDPAT